MPPQLIEDDVRRRVALQVDDDPDAFAAGLVPDVRYAFDALVLGRLGDLFDKSGLSDLIRDLGEDDRAALAAAFLDMSARAHEDGTASGCVGAANARLPEDQGSRREIRALHMLHQP